MAGFLFPAKVVFYLVGKYTLITV